jgi:hypothetical protein
MKFEVMNVFKPFMAFTPSLQPYNSRTYHVGPYVGPLFQKFAIHQGLCGPWNGNANYNKIWLREFWMTMLLTIHNRLTPTPFIVEPLNLVLHKLGVFGVFVSTKEASMGLFWVELLFYKQTTMTNEIFNLLNWWVEHEQQFPNIGFFAW